MCQIIKIGDGHAFVCGGSHPDHKCDEKSGVLLLADGNRVPDTKENQVLYQDEIRGGSVCCSVCGSAAIDKAMWMGD